jgi:hypothetical protein
MDATLWLLVGASLDQTIKQLPTRRRIGVVAFSEYSKAGDLGRGIAWYATLGIGAALLTLGAAVVGLSDRPDGPTAVALWLALVLTVAHSLATARAAPTNSASAPRLVTRLAWRRSSTASSAGRPPAPPSRSSRC